MIQLKRFIEVDRAMPSSGKTSFLYRQLPNSLLLALNDSAMLFIALFFGNLLVYWVFGAPVSIKYSLLIIPSWWMVSSAAGLLPGWGLGEVEEVRRIELSLCAIFTFAALVYFFSRERVLPSRMVYMVAWGFSAVAIPIGRWGVRTLLIRLKRWGCPVAIYGTPENAAIIITALQRSPELGYIPVAVFTEAEASVRGIPVTDNIEQSLNNFTVVAVSLPSFSSQELAKLIDHTLSGIGKVILFPDMRGGIFMSIRSRSFGSLIGLEISANLLNPFSRIIKRMFDLVIVLITAPFWLAVCIALFFLVLVSDRASPFYTQVRMGKNGQMFRIIKFRTMVPDAERCLEEALDKNPVLREEWETHFKLKKDPRVTPVGRVLRMFSLDELPQLINVLAGRMSLVGPRPLPDYHHEALSDNARLPRNRVNPGLTGLWQIRGRSDNDISEMETWDTYYVRNWSIWLDAVILARTLVSMLSAKGAY